VLKLLQGAEDLLGFGADAVAGMDVDPADSVAGIEDHGGGHGQGHGAVGVDVGQVESELPQPQREQNATTTTKNLFTATPRC